MSAFSIIVTVILRPQFPWATVREVEGGAWFLSHNKLVGSRVIRSTSSSAKGKNALGNLEGVEGLRLGVDVLSEERMV